MALNLIVGGAINIMLGVGVIWGGVFQMKRAFEDGRFYSLYGKSFTLDRDGDKQYFWMSVAGRAVLLFPVGGAFVIGGFVLFVAGVVK
jgi:hypothetical protein